MEEAEIDFPRGGAPTLTPLEAKKVRAIAKKDALFGENLEPPKKKKKVSSKIKSSSEDNDNVKTKKILLEHFSFKYLVKGMLVLGYVKEIHFKEVIVGLPSGLNGYIATNEIQIALNDLCLKENGSDDDEEKTDIAELKEIFKIGCILPLVVKDLFSNMTGYKKIKLSPLPADLNEHMSKKSIQKNMMFWGIVSSVEDHGFSVSLGKEGLSSCFLPTAQAENPDYLKLGMMKWFCVTRFAKIPTVTDKSKDIKKIMMSAGDMNFSSLLPGQLVKCNLEKELDGCIIGKIGSSFEMIIELLHTELDEEFKKKIKKKGRIIHINPNTKQIGVSLLPELVKFSDSIIDTTLATGESLENCLVLKKNNKSLILEVPNGKCGSVHVSRLSDEHVEKIGKKYNVGTKHNCRVLGYSALDSVYTLSMRKSDIERKYLSYKDIHVGEVISGSVITLESFGALVKVSDHIQGLCATRHLADIPLKNPSKKFVKDKKVVCRVLSVQPNQKKLQLTHKKTLVSSELPIIDSYENTKVGTKTHGFVQSIKPYGLIVSFYNNVRSLMMKSNVLIPEGSSLEESFYVGKVIQCQVVSVDPTNKKMSVSMKNIKTSGDDKQSLVGKTIQSTSFVSSSSSQLTLKSKEYEESFFMKKEHLSDFVSLSNDWMEFVTSVATLPEDFKDLVVIEKEKKSGKKFLSNKKIFQNGLNNLSFQDLKVGMVHAGVITHIMDFGVFVELAPGIKGLAPTSHLTDRFVSNPSKLFTVGQSVIAKITDIDEEKQRFVVSLQPSALVSSTENDDRLSIFIHKQLLNQYLSERNKLCQFINSSSDETLKLLLSVEKEVIIAKVVSVTNDGVNLQYEIDDDIIDGLIPRASKHEGVFEREATVQCLVVFVEIAKKRFIGTCMNKAINDHIKASGESKESKISNEKRLKTVVCFSNNDLIVVLLPEHQHTIAYMPMKMHLNDMQPYVNGSINHEISAKFESYSELGLIVSDLDQTIDTSDPKDIKIGSLVNVVIKGIKPNQVNVSLCNGRIRGRIHISNITDDIKDDVYPLKHFTPSQILTAKLIGFRDVKTHNYLPVTSTNKTHCYAELSLKESDKKQDGVDESPEEFKLTDYKKGDQVVCFVQNFNKYEILVSVGSNIRGKIPILLSSNDVEDFKKLKSKYKAGLALKAEVTEVDTKYKQLKLSRIGDPEGNIKKGANTIGRISKVIKNGVLMELANRKAGMIHVTELNDNFVENPLEGMEENKYLKCQILSIDDKTDHIDLSTRNSRLMKQESISEGIDRIINGYDDIKEGEIVRGYVKTCTKVGVFVSLSTSITGRVQIKNLSQYFVKDYFTLFPVGKLVKAKILSINPTNNNIDLSLRGKDVNDKDPAPPPPKRKKNENEGDEEKNGASEAKKRKIVDTSIDDGEADDSGVDNDADRLEESDEENVEDEEVKEDGDEDETDDEEELKVEGEKPSLELGGTFDWSVDKKKKETSDSEDSDDNEEEDKKSSKKSKKQKRAAKKAEEESLHKAELALLDTERQLESAEDFDRLVLASPNSSIVWIQYMAFHLHAAEVEKAMAVGRRALKTISFREEQEKMNIWVALLNLENSYGTKESLGKLFQEAVKVNEPIKIFIKMVELYIKNGKNEEAETLYQKMLKRFKQSKKVWVGYAFFLMKIGKMEQARNLLQRSLKSLPERKHVSTILKFAIMEFKLGEAQRGATIFESLLKNYPKKTDIWSIYIDMWAKQGDFEQVRNIFERVTTLNLSTKKMKFLFKRYVAFEEQHGNQTSVENVRRKAAEFIDRHLFDDEADN